MTSGRVPPLGRPTRLARLITLGSVMLVLLIAVGVLGPAARAATRPFGGLWVSRYKGPAPSGSARAIAVSPDGQRVFVSGANSAFGTVAYDSATGTRLWVARYNGPLGQDFATAIAISPDGTRVFVTGRSAGTGGGSSYATVAYDASAGTQLWVARFNGPGRGIDEPLAVATSPDGSRVFVTGDSFRSGTGLDYATVAYVAVTGARQWVARYDDAGHHGDFATAIGVSRDGSAVFVTGGSTDVHGVSDFATVSYQAGTGAQEWAARFKGSGGTADIAYALTVSPDGNGVFVTGESIVSDDESRFATVAYDATGGVQQWVSAYDCPGSNALAMGMSPDGTAVFVTGVTMCSTTNEDFTTISYDAGTGSERWVARYNDPQNGVDVARALAVSADGTRVYVAGQSRGSTGSSDYATIAYDSKAGTRLWLKRYDGPANGSDVARALAVSPHGTQVFVTGESASSSGAVAYATVAYAG
jgi:WD40 repeat protein